MTVLALMRRRTESFKDAQFAEVLEAEAEEARRLYQEGHVRAIYGRHDCPGAVLVFEAPSLEEAQKLCQRLPLYSRGMLEGQFVPCGPYRGFLPRNP